MNRVCTWCRVLESVVLEMRSLIVIVPSYYMSERGIVQASVV